MNTSCVVIGDTSAGGGGRYGLVVRWYDSRWLVQDAQKRVCLCVRARLWVRAFCTYPWAYASEGGFA